MDNWINKYLFKWLENKWKKVPYEKKNCVKTLIIDYVPIENYMFSLLHTKIGVGDNFFILTLNGSTKELYH